MKWSEAEPILNKLCKKMKSAKTEEEKKEYKRKIFEIHDKVNDVLDKMKLI